MANPGEADTPIVATLAVLAVLLNVVAFVMFVRSYVIRPRHTHLPFPATALPTKNAVASSTHAAAATAASATAGSGTADLSSPPLSPPGSACGPLDDDPSSVVASSLTPSLAALQVERSELISAFGLAAGSKDFPPSSRALRVAWGEEPTDKSREA